MTPLTVILHYTLTHNALKNAVTVCHKLRCPCCPSHCDVNSLEMCIFVCLENGESVGVHDQTIKHCLGDSGRIDGHHNLNFHRTIHRYYLAHQILHLAL